MSMAHRIHKGCLNTSPRFLVQGTEYVGKATLATAAPKKPFIHTENGLDQNECGILVPVTRQADTAWRATQAAERAWIAAAKMRTPEAWRAAVDGINDKVVRIQVACVVWWDHYSTRPAPDAWHHLDEYLGAWTIDLRADPKNVRAALIQIGYPVRLAAQRAKTDEPTITVSRGNRREKR